MKPKLVTILVLCLAGALEAQDGPAGLLTYNHDPLTQLAAKLAPKGRTSCGVPGLAPSIDNPRALAQSLVKNLNSPAGGRLPSSSRSLSQVITVPDGTTDQNFSIMLNDGVLITGMINNPSLSVSVSARNSGGLVFKGMTDMSQSSYTILVPNNDTYTIQACFSINFGGMSITTFTYNDPTAVMVSGDTSHDITLPSETANTVSGRLLNPDPRFFIKSISFVSPDGTVGTSASVSFVDGTYAARVPDGTYAATLTESGLVGTQFDSTSIVLGNVVVSGDTNADFTSAPTAMVSGTVTMADGSAPPSNSVIIFNDANVNPPTGNCSSAVSNGATELLDPSGNYQVLVATGLTYNPSTIVGVLPSNPPQNAGFLLTTFPSLLVSGDTMQSFAEPTLPGTVTFSGNVTDSASAPVNGANVGGFSQQVTGAPNALFATSTMTDMNGNFSMIMLSGTNDLLSVSPPQ